MIYEVINCAINVDPEFGDDSWSIAHFQSREDANALVAMLNTRPVEGREYKVAEHSVAPAGTSFSQKVLEALGEYNSYYYDMVAQVREEAGV